MKLDLANSFDQSKAKAYLDKLIKSGAKCEIKKVRQPKTVNQRSYLHVCLSFFCAETGYSIQEAKEWFSLQLPEIMRYDKNGVSFRKSTEDLDTIETGTLIDKVREVTLNEFGVYICDSQEYIQNKFDIDRQLEYVR